MPRYFFHRADGSIEPDTVGTVLPNLAAARTEAVVSLGRTLKDNPERVWDGGDLRMEVTDEAGLCLFMVAVVAFDAPAVAGGTLMDAGRAKSFRAVLLNEDGTPSDKVRIVDATGDLAAVTQVQVICGPAVDFQLWDGDRLALTFRQSKQFRSRAGDSAAIRVIPDV